MMSTGRDVPTHTQTREPTSLRFPSNCPAKSTTSPSSASSLDSAASRCGFPPPPPLFECSAFSSPSTSPCRAFICFRRVCTAGVKMLGMLLLLLLVLLVVLPSAGAYVCVCVGEVVVGGWND